MRKLRPHPATCDPVPTAVRASAVWGGEGRLLLAYEIEGPMGELVLPSPGEGRRQDGLWSTTCFELFIGFDDTADYYEFNFSPSYDWCAYHFAGYRSGRRDVHALSLPTFRVDRTVTKASARIHVVLPSSCAERRRAARVGLASVVEQGRGVCSYWALSHPGDKPDFHDSRAFVVRLNDRKTC